jgi:arsenate reductase
MAEGLVNHDLADTWEALSAGTEPSEEVRPLAVRAMEEIGIDISSQFPKHTDHFRGQEFDVVITLCGSAAENCPLWLGEGQVVHMGYPDPAAATGSESERLQVFRQVRDRIREEVLGYLEQWEVPAPKGESYDTANL